MFGGAYGDKIYSFTGSPLTGTIETAEVPLTVGKHSIVTRIYPYYEGGDLTVQIGTRNNQVDEPTFTSAISPNTDGFAPFRAQGRYHRAKISISGSWSTALGIDIDATAVGGR